MPRGRKTFFSIRLTPAERLTLLTWQRSTTIPAGLARRARLLLLLAVTACNRNGPGLQSARFPAHITCLYRPCPAHMSCL